MTTRDHKKFPPALFWLWRAFFFFFVGIGIFKLLLTVTAFYGVFFPFRTGTVELAVAVRAFPFKQLNLSLRLNLKKVSRTGR